MKDNDMLLYAGVAVAAYFLFIKPKSSTGVTTIAPITHTSLPLATTTTPVAVTANPVSQIATSIAKLIKGNGSGGANPSTNATVAPYVPDIPIYSGSGGANPSSIDMGIFTNDDNGSSDQTPTPLEQDFRQGMFDSRNEDFNEDEYA